MTTPFLAESRFLVAAANGVGRCTALAADETFTEAQRSRSTSEWIASCDRLLRSLAAIDVPCT